MELNEYTYLVDTVMDSDIENRLLSLQTANGSRFEFNLENQFESGYSKGRYKLEDDRTNGFVKVVSRMQPTLSYHIPIAAIEIIVIDTQ